MKKFFGEFKKFITRGNILDLAVGVIVGGAFTAIVTSLTNNIIRPLINWIIALIGGKQGLSSVYTFLSKAYQTDASGNYILNEAGNKVLDLSHSIYIDWGLFITAIIDFFIIAFTVFLIIKVVNASREQLEKFGDMLEHQSKKEVRAENKELKKIAKEQGRKFKDVKKEHEEEKKRLAEEKAQLEAEEKAKQEELEKLNNPTEQELLKEIRDLLIAQNKKSKK